MSSTHFAVFTRTLLQALCIVVFGITFIHSEFLNADPDRYGDSRENTRAAIDELNDVLRMLFPIVPHKSHLLLRQTNHIRRFGNFLSTTPRHFETSIQSIDQLATAENLPNVEDKHVKGSDHAQEKEEKSGHLFANPSSLIPIESRIAVGLTSQGHIQEQSHEQPFWFSQPKPTHLQALLLAREHADSPKGSNAGEVHQRMHSAGGAQHSHQPHLPSLKEHYSHGLPGTHLGTGNAPSKLFELTTPALGKRGPECMRRCIMQRLLHPVQCHSLC